MKNLFCPERTLLVKPNPATGQSPTPLPARGGAAGRAALEWLSQHKNDRFFTLIHYMDPHDPYFVHPYEGRGIARVDNQNPDPTQSAEMLELYAGEIEPLSGAVLAPQPKENKGHSKLLTTWLIRHRIHEFALH